MLLHIVEEIYAHVYECVSTILAADIFLHADEHLLYW